MSASDVINKASVKVNDRVKRKTGDQCLGTVREVRAEVTVSVADLKEKALLVNVLWDNGTLSYFTPAALDLVK